MAYIVGNRIIYAKHQVICEAGCADAQYMRIMKDYTLSPNGDAETHLCELDAVNNDGTWTVRPLPAKYSHINHAL